MAAEIQQVARPLVPTVTCSISDQAGTICAQCRACWRPQHSLDHRTSLITASLTSCQTLAPRAECTTCSCGQGNQRLEPIRRRSSPPPTNCSKRRDQPSPDPNPTPGTEAHQYVDFLGGLEPDERPGQAATSQFHSQSDLSLANAHRSFELVRGEPVGTLRQIGMAARLRSAINKW